MYNCKSFITAVHLNSVALFHMQLRSNRESCWLQNMSHAVKFRACLAVLGSNDCAGAHATSFRSRDFTCRWLSTAYMTWALLGIPHPASEGESGWAWVPIQLDTEQDNGAVAHAMSEFVAQTLRALQLEQDGEVPPEQKRTLGNATMKSDIAVGMPTLFL